MNEELEVEMVFDPRLEEDDIARNKIARGYDEEMVLQALADAEEEDDEMIDSMIVEGLEIVDHTEFLRTAVGAQDHLIRTVDLIETKLASSQEAVISPYALEALSYLIKQIDKDVGLHKSSKTSLAALEAFDNTSSVSKRQSSLNALEGIKEGLGSLWEGIKSTIVKIWEKIRDFWKKHVSTLGRMQKKIKRYNKKVDNIKGSPDFSKEIKIPGSMNKAFVSPSDLKAVTIHEYLSRHISSTDTTISVGKRFVEELKNIIKDVGKASGSGDVGKDLDSLKGNKEPKKEDLHIADENKPMIQKFYGEVSFEGEGDEVKVKFEKKEANIENPATRKIELASTSDMKKLLNSCWDLCESTINLGKDFEAANKEFDAGMKKIDTFVGRDQIKDDDKPKTLSDKKDEKTGADGNSEDKGEEPDKDPAKATAARELSIRYRQLASVSPTINSKICSLNLTAMKESLSFIKICLKNYNTAGEK